MLESFRKKMGHSWHIPESFSLETFTLLTIVHHFAYVVALLNVQMSCCCTLTFRILHFEVYDILKCKHYLIGFLDELGNLRPKIHTFENVKFFYILQQRTQIPNCRTVKVQAR